MASYIDYNKCISCKICYDHCPEGLYGIDINGRVYPKHPDECWLCGVCQMDCPVNAIQVVYDTDSKLIFIP